MGRWLCLAIALCLLAPAASAFGQAQNTGSILGSVTDPSGAVIPGAKVTAIEPSTGFNRSVETNKSGEFTLPDIPVGTYLLTVTAGDNFDTYQQDGVVIDADKAVKIVAKMTVGNKGETVNVVSQGIGVDTDNSTIKTIIDTQLVQNLPIDGNNTVALAGLLPGVTDLNAPATNTSDRGGPTAATLSTLVGSCKRLQVDPFAYLKDVLDRLSTHPAERLGELLPYAWIAVKPFPRLKVA